MNIDLFGDGIGNVRLVDHIGTDKTIVNSARVSFGQDNDRELTNRDKKLIKYLIKHRHTSTLEHNLITFMFEVPLFIRAQHMRHRTWSYNEISRRYTDVDLKFYVPQGFRTQHESNRQASNDELIDPVITPRFADTYINSSEAINKFHEHSLELFNQLVDNGVCREQARGVLPQNLYTRYYGTTNLNNLLKFIDLRLHEGAQWEIQQVAKACLDIATELWPFTVGAYREIRGEV
jgi:thymidylate synthase (FAD)